MKTSQWRRAVKNRCVFSVHLKALSIRNGERCAGGRFVGFAFGGLQCGRRNFSWGHGTIFSRCTDPSLSQSTHCKHKNWSNVSACQLCNIISIGGLKGTEFLIVAPLKPPWVSYWHHYCRQSIPHHCIVNPLIATLKLQSNRPLYSNTVIGTLAVDGWAVTFGTARRGLSGAAARPGLSLLYQM